MTVSSCVVNVGEQNVWAQGPFDDVNGWLARTLGLDHHQFKRLSVHFRAPEWIAPSTFIHLYANHHFGSGFNYITKTSGPS
jgi:uncharacterized membrane protein YjdF